MPSARATTTVSSGYAMAAAAAIQMSPQKSPLIRPTWRRHAPMTERIANVPVSPMPTIWKAVIGRAPRGSSRSQDPSRQIVDQDAERSAHLLALFARVVGVSDGDRD